MLTEQQIRDRQFTRGSLSVVKSFLQTNFDKLREEIKSLGDPLSKLLNNIFKARLVDPVKLDAPEIGKSFTRMIKEIEGVNKTLTELVKRDPIKVENKEIDFKDVITKLSLLEQAIRKIPQVTESNIGTAKIVSALTEVKRQIAAIPKPEKIEIPQPETIRFPESFSMREAASIISALTVLREDLRALPQNMPKGTQADLSPLLEGINQVKLTISSLVFPKLPDFPTVISIDNFPPQKIPQPVTNININSLRGPVKATTVTVTNTATELPGIALAHRRSMILFNNDTDQVLYLGHSGVTINNGIPVLPQQYSPPLDIGDRVVLYGIVSSGSIDVRVLEASMDDIGT